MSRATRSFSRRVLLSQLALVVAILALVTGVFAWMGARNVIDVSETRALATARTLASTAEVREGSTRASQSSDPQPEPAIVDLLQAMTNDLIARSDIQFAVITDDQGIRLTHPNPERIGERVSTDPSEALAGRENVTHEEGTLGESVRAKVPIYSSEGDGSVVGEVSVGIRSSVLDANLRSEFLALGAVAVLALALSAAAALGLGRRLRRETLGVGPEELADMARDQGAVLHGLDDGVLGFSTTDELTLSNSTAGELLGFPPVDADEAQSVKEAGHAGAAGHAVSAVGHAEERQADEIHYTRIGEVPEAISSMMAQAPASGEALRRRVTVGDRTLLATAVRVSRDGVSVGGVVTLRDETQMLSMARQLESETTKAQALQAQRHEFANRLHTVLGLVDIGASDEARSYLTTILRTGPIAASVEGIELVSDPYLLALLEAKGAAAARAEVALSVAPDSMVLGRVQAPEDVTLILGNLIDNAIRAARSSSGDGGRSPGEARNIVEVQLLSSGADLHVVVSDTGDGIVEEDWERIFDEGFSDSARPSDAGPSDANCQSDADTVHGLGIGLALCRQVARRHEGRVWVINGHDLDLGGASFGMILPTVLGDGAPAPVISPEDSELEDTAPDDEETR